MSNTKAELLAQVLEDPVFFCETFLSDWFYIKTPGKCAIPWFHRANLAIMTREVDFLEQYGEVDLILKYFPDNFERNDKGQLCLKYHPNTLLMIPRDFAKTTIIRAFIMWTMCTKSRNFILFLSQTGSHSEAECQQIKTMFEVNDKIKLVFGDLVPKRNEVPSRKWTDDEIQTKNNVHLVAKGAEAQVRGLNRGGRRPDLIIMDDLENEKSILTEDQRDKVKRWCYSAVMPALDSGNPNASIIACGTLLHRDALIANLQNDPKWHTTRFGAILPDGTPLWKERKPLQFIQETKASMLAAGQLEGFYLEYMNEVRATEAAIFKPEYFKIETLDYAKIVSTALALDPAISGKKNADYCAYAVVGRTNDGITWLIDTYAERGMPPQRQIDKFFELAKQHNVHICGVESVAYQQALVSMIQEQMHLYQFYRKVEPITSKIRKEERIRGTLQPRMASGRFKMVKAEPLFKSQCLDFGRDHDDVPDAVAMAIMLLDDFTAYSVPAEVYGAQYKNWTSHTKPYLRGRAP